MGSILEYKDKEYVSI